MGLKPEELKLTIKNPTWRLNRLYKITNKEKKVQPFSLNAAQTLLSQNNSKLSVVLKARQMGISTYFLLKYLDQAIFNPNQTIAILSHDRESLQRLFKIIRFAHKTMHPDIKPQLDRGGGSKYRMYFPEVNSEIYCTLEAVSDAINSLHISEMALNLHPDRIFTSLDAVPHDTGTISIETTPRGFNHFYDFWKKETGYQKFFFPWYIEPSYALQNNEHITYTKEEKELVKKAKALYNCDINPGQIAFRRFKISQKKHLSDFLQEYPEDDSTCFISSGSPALDVVKVQQRIQKAKPPITDLGSLKIYWEKKQGASYVIGADTAEGFGLDYSVAVVMNVETRQVSAVLRGHFKPFEFAHELVSLSKLYNTPRLAVERNNHGHAVLLELNKHLNYPNLYTHTDLKLGWVTDRVTRPIMLNTFIDAVENNHISINDIDILNECLTLVVNNNKIEAAQGKHDDTIIATSIALQLCVNRSTLEVYDNIENKVLM